MDNGKGFGDLAAARVLNAHKQYMFHRVESQDLVVSVQIGV